jgi:hypothetical protein
MPTSNYKELLKLKDMLQDSSTDKILSICTARKQCQRELLHSKIFHNVTKKDKELYAEQKLRNICFFKYASLIRVDLMASTVNFKPTIAT